MVIVAANETGNYSVPSSTSPAMRFAFCGLYWELSGSTGILIVVFWVWILLSVLALLCWLIIVSFDWKKQRYLKQQHFTERIFISSPANILSKTSADEIQVGSEESALATVSVQEVQVQPLPPVDYTIPVP